MGWRWRSQLSRRLWEWFSFLPYLFSFGELGDYSGFVSAGFGVFVRVPTDVNEAGGSGVSEADFLGDGSDYLNGVFNVRVNSADLCYDVFGTKDEFTWGGRFLRSFGV